MATSVPTISAFSGPYRFLSNFFPFDRVGEKRQWQRVHPWGGIDYRVDARFQRYADLHCPSTEHAYQAAKSSDLGTQQLIAAMSNSFLAKKAGGHCQLRDGWTKPFKLQLMYEVCKLKFMNEELGEKLVATYPAVLIEGNWWNDTFWGICKGHGQNHLGRILMRVREELRHGR